MNQDKMQQQGLNSAGNRIQNPAMSNPGFLSLAGLMAQATRNMGHGNPFMTGSQGSQQPSMANAARFDSNNMMNMNSNSSMGIGAMNSGSLQTDDVTHDSPPSLMGQSQGALGQQEGSQMQQGPRSNYADWPWGDYPTTQEGANALLERGRSRNWTYEETLELISMYTSDEWQGKFGSEKKNHRSIWVSLAAALSKRKDVSGDEARQRLNNLKAFYNRTRRQLFSGEITSPQWEYWEPLHAFLGRPQPYLPLPPASPLPQFPHHFGTFQGNNQVQSIMRRSPEDSSHSQLPNMSPHSSTNTPNPHPLFGALGFPSHFGSGYHNNGGTYPPKVDFSSNGGGEKETINEGEDRKMDLSSLVAGNMNENSMGSVGDNPGTSNDCPIPSPEQYLTEEMDQQPTPSNIQVQRPESYKLRHNNHLSLVLESLAGDESFMDVTLTAQGKAIKAHKSVLSAVSPYFKSVLKENPCQHPIIIMPRDIRFGELNNIISYVYKGEMTVAAEDLPSLLRTAEILQVTGLTPSDSSAMSGTSSSILGQIRGATAAAAANSNMSTSCSSPSPSPAKTVNKKSARYHSTPKLKEVPQSSSYDNEMPDKIDPLDYLNPDMACVKEELSSDDEKNYEASTETAEDVQFPTQIPQDLPVDSSYNSKKGCPLSKKRKSSTETSSLHDDPDEDAGNHSDSLTDECLINQTALFVCPYCFESHRPTEVLQTHLRLKHPSKPSFLCKCGKVFVRQALFEQHKKSCDKL